MTKEAAADTGNSVQKHGKRHCSEAPAADTVPGSRFDSTLWLLSPDSHVVCVMATSNYAEVAHAASKPV